MSKILNCINLRVDLGKSIKINVMNKTWNLAKALGVVFAASTLLSSCGGGGNPTSSDPGSYSTTTGLDYNDEENDGFMVNDFAGQPEGPNLVFIEGGRTTLGSFEEDLTMQRDNIERTVTVASFYMDETEIANIHWLEYLHYIKRDSSAEAYQAAIPDTTVWASELAFNDPYVDHYLRYPGFRYFPVVGV